MRERIRYHGWETEKDRKRVTQAENGSRRQFLGAINNKPTERRRDRERGREREREREREKNGENGVFSPVLDDLYPVRVFNVLNVLVVHGKRRKKRKRKRKKKKKEEVYQNTHIYLLHCFLQFSFSFFFTSRAKNKQSIVNMRCSCEAHSSADIYVAIITKCESPL